MALTAREIEKNKLDLLYQQNLQAMNAYYLAATSGVIGFAGTFVWFPEKFAFGGMLSFYLFAVFFYLIQKTRKEMSWLLSRIDALKGSQSQA